MCDAEISSVVISSRLLIQIVHFHEGNAGGIVYAAHDRGVVTWWQCCNNRRLPWVCWSMAAVPDPLHLIVHNNPADYRGHPVIVRGNQSSGRVVQFQCRISQRVRNAIMGELRPKGANNYLLIVRPFD